MAWLSSALGMIGAQQPGQQQQYVLPERKPLGSISENMGNILNANDLAAVIARNDMERQKKAQNRNMMTNSLMGMFGSGGGYRSTPQQAPPQQPSQPRLAS